LHHPSQPAGDLIIFSLDPKTDNRYESEEGQMGVCCGVRLGEEIWNRHRYI